MSDYTAEAGLDRALARVEASLGTSLVLADVAAASGWSPFHFHRIFAATVGVPVMTWVRHRRLSWAAELLEQTDLPLVEIAMEVGFATQSALTRAFTRRFSVPPGRFRQERPDWALLRVDPLSRTLMEMRVRATTKPIATVEFPGARVVGLQDTFKPLDLGIPQLWDAAIGRKAEGELDGVSLGGRSFGICVSGDADGPTTETLQEDFDYVAGWEILEGDPTAPWVTVDLLPGLYAVFTHRGPIMTIGETVRFIWSTWVPNHMEAAGFALRESPDFELYGDRFKGPAPDSEVDIYVPVRALTVSQAKAI